MTTDVMTTWEQPLHSWEVMMTWEQPLHAWNVMTTWAKPCALKCVDLGKTLACLGYNDDLGTTLCA